MADDKKNFNQNGYLMLNGPDDTLWIPMSSNKSWLTLFYALPKEMIEKQKEYHSLPRCPYDVLRTEKYDELINLNYSRINLFFTRNVHNYKVFQT